MTKNTTFIYLTNICLNDLSAVNVVLAKLPANSFWGNKCETFSKKKILVYLFAIFFVGKREAEKANVTSLLRRLQAQTLPDATPPVGKINPFSKMALPFEPLMEC